jgi:hypothetical protein
MLAAWLSHQFSFHKAYECYWPDRILSSLRALLEWEGGGKEYCKTSSPNFQCIHMMITISASQEITEKIYWCCHSICHSVEIAWIVPFSSRPKSNVLLFLVEFYN